MIPSILTPSQTLEELLAENCQVLSQLGEWIGKLSPTVYRRPLGKWGHHTLGKHTRHIIDHYAPLWSLSDNDQSFIDYEQRQREEAVELQPRLAAARLEEINTALSTWQGPHDIKIGFHYRLGDAHMMALTSLERELAFLASHTIHHMALIGLLSEGLGIETSQDFGVHPSTLRYRRRKENIPHTASTLSSTACVCMGTVRIGPARWVLP